MPPASPRISGWMPSEIEDVRAAGLLHDIGKLNVSRDLLHKAAAVHQRGIFRACSSTSKRA